jgi:FkbM family methyltransferase
MQSWFDVKGDETYAVNWPLTGQSIVVEIGAYKGRWSTQIVDKYGCKVFAYEPQPWAFNELVQESKTRPTLIPFNYAVGLKDGSFPMSEWETDACSFMYTDRRKRGVARMREATQVFAELAKYGHIDLVMMNIEGYEWLLVPYLLDMGIGSIIERLCVQWHTFVDDPGPRYDIICDKFREQGFERLWSYFPTLEAWCK